MESIQKAKEENRKYFNRSVRDLPKLQPNDSVRIQMNGEWVTGRVINLAGMPRSYIVEGPTILAKLQAPQEDNPYSSHLPLVRTMMIMTM